MDYSEDLKMITHEELAEKLLKERYNKEFCVEKVEGQNIFDEVYSVIVYEQENAEMLFRATVNADGSGISDNYVGKLMALQLSDRIARNLDDLEGIYFIYSSYMIDPINIVDDKMDIQDYIESHPTNRYNIYLYYCPDEFEFESFYNCIDKMFNQIKGLNGILYINIVDEEGIKSVRDYLEFNDRIYDDYKKIIKKNSQVKLLIHNSVFTNSKNEIRMLMEHK